MKKALKNWQSFLFAVALIGGLIAAIPAVTLAHDQDEHGIPPNVISPGETYYGMTYGDWSAAWWQYTIEAPDGAIWSDDSSPNFDCAYGKLSTISPSALATPVFFLVGGGGPNNTTVTRTCTVPKGKAIFFPIINVECSTMENIVPDPIKACSNWIPKSQHVARWRGYPHL